MISVALLVILISSMRLRRTNNEINKVEVKKGDLNAC